MLAEETLAEWEVEVWGGGQARMAGGINLMPRADLQVGPGAPRAQTVTDSESESPKRVGEKRRGSVRISLAAALLIYCTEDGPSGPLALYTSNYYYRVCGSIYGRNREKLWKK